MLSHTQTASHAPSLTSPQMTLLHRFRETPKKRHRSPPAYPDLSRVNPHEDFPHKMLDFTDSFLKSLHL